MRSSIFDEKINLVKLLNGTYKRADKEMVVATILNYQKENNCSLRYAYDMNVEGNPSYSAFLRWRREFE
jgi:hypothetical protein